MSLQDVVAKLEGGFGIDGSRRPGEVHGKGSVTDPWVDQEFLCRRLGSSDEPFPKEWVEEHDSLILPSDKVMRDLVVGGEEVIPGRGGGETEGPHRVEDLLEGEWAEGGKADGQDLCNASEALSCWEPEVELQQEDFGEGQGKDFEAGGLENEVSSLYQVKSQLDKEEATLGGVHQVLLKPCPLSALLCHLSGSGRYVCHDALTLGQSEGHVITEVFGNPLVHIKVVQAEM